MKYEAYDSFIDYLFSEDSKSTTYGDLECLLTSAGTYDTFKSSRPDGSILRGDVSRFFIPSYTFAYPSARMDCRPEVSDSNGLDSETDKTYEEVFNVPASGSLELGSKYIASLVEKAKLNAELLGRSVDGKTAAEILRDEIPFKSEYDEEEYDAYGVPVTFLNSDRPGLLAEDVTVSGDKITLASGCLLAVHKDRLSDGADSLFPIGYIDFEKPVPSTRYEVKFDPSGIIQIH